MGRGGFCCLHCCDGLCNGINKIFNFIMLLAGLGVVGFGVYLAHQTSWTFDYFTVTLTSVGGLLFMMCFGYLFFHNSYCFNTLYIWCMALLVLLDGTGAGLLFTQKKSILDSLKKELGPANSKFLDGNNLTITAYVTMGLTGLQLLAVILTFCHRNILIERERERLDIEGDGYDALDDEDDVEVQARAPRRRVERTSELASRSTTYLGTPTPAEEETEGQAAASKYRSKYADLYTKYGIDKK